ncbi:MAG: GAF domain-containing protein [Acidimicrobiia bacterium]
MTTLTAEVPPSTSPRTAPVVEEARLVGIRGASTPTLEAVDRRRSQLWTVAFSGLVCLAASIAVLASSDGHHLGVVGSAPFRIGTVVLVLAFTAYVMDKEHHLRRLSQLLISERVSTAAMADRLRELESLHAAGAAMNSVLVIEEVLRVILTSAFELLHPLSGSILLLEDGDTLATVCSVGDTSGAQSRAKVGEGLVGRVALQRVPILVNGRAADGEPVPTESALCVPLIHRGQLLGVLDLNGSAARAYTEHDLQSVSIFADHAAIAIANARLNDTERELTARLSAALAR